MIAEHIKNGITKLYTEGLTQQEIAKRAGISGNTIISQLLSRKKKASNLRLSVAEKFISIIPEIQILVNGKRIHKDWEDGNTDAEKTVAPELQVAEDEATYEGKIDKLEKQIMESSELNSKTKVKLYRMIREL